MDRTNGPANVFSVVGRFVAVGLVGLVLFTGWPAPTALAAAALIGLLSCRDTELVTEVLDRIKLRFRYAVLLAVALLVIVLVVDWLRLRLPPTYRNAITVTWDVDSDKPYKAGELVAGIRWEPGFVMSRLRLHSTAPVVLTNVDLRLKLGGMAFQSKQITSVPDVSISPVTKFGLFTNFRITTYNEDGTVKQRIATTPEQEQALRDQSLTDTFTLHVPRFVKGMPIEIVFVGSATRGSLIGGFWRQQPTRVDVIPEWIEVSGSYGVTHRDRIVQLPGGGIAKAKR